MRVAHYVLKDAPVVLQDESVRKGIIDRLYEVATNPKEESYHEALRLLKKLGAKEEVQKALCRDGMIFFLTDKIRIMFHVLWIMKPKFICGVDYNLNKRNTFYNNYTGQVLFCKPHRPNGKSYATYETKWEQKPTTFRNILRDIHGVYVDEYGVANSMPMSQFIATDLQRVLHAPGEWEREQQEMQQWFDLSKKIKQ